MIRSIASPTRPVPAPPSETTVPVASIARRRAARPSGITSSASRTAGSSVARCASFRAAAKRSPMRSPISSSTSASSVEAVFSAVCRFSAWSAASRSVTPMTKTNMRKGMAFSRNESRLPRRCMGSASPGQGRPPKAPGVPAPWLSSHRSRAPKPGSGSLAGTSVPCRMASPMRPLKPEGDERSEPSGPSSSGSSPSGSLLRPSPLAMRPAPSAACRAANRRIPTADTCPPSGAP